MSFTNLLIGIIGSLLAAIIAAVFSRAFLRNNVTQKYLHQFFGYSLGKSLRRDPRKAIKALVRWLADDQSTHGVHFGQFGSGANLREERLFQTSREKLEAKPRLYLTGWPCFVLHELGLGNKQKVLAAEGLRRLLKDGPVEVSLGASQQTPPDSQPTIRSYRHTIRAVQILARLNPNNPNISLILGLMLDKRNRWQNPDGGWKQCDKERTDSDLWGSSYAFALLAAALRDQLVSQDIKDTVHESLGNTMKYLKEEWQKTRWSYGGASPEQNGVQIFHETIATFKRYDKLFAEQLQSWVSSWLSPSGLLSDSYFQACHEVTLASANARVAYALFLAGEPTSTWRPLLLVAVNQFEQGANSADAAFMLHMVSHLSQS